MMMAALLMTIAFFGMCIYSIAGDVCDDDDCIIWYICMLYVRAGEGKLSWDGMKNVKNFNISPQKCIKNSTTDSKTNVKISEACNLQRIIENSFSIFLENISCFYFSPDFVSSATKQRRLLIYSGPLLLTDQFLTWKRNTKREVNSRVLEIPVIYNNNQTNNEQFWTLFKSFISYIGQLKQDKVLDRSMLQLIWGHSNRHPLNNT